MILKLQCMNVQLAVWIHANWPDDTIRRGSAVLCIHIPPFEIGTIQARTGAHTVPLTTDGDDSDVAVVKRFLSPQPTMGPCPSGSLHGETESVGFG